jgi:flagellar biosynthetic protein FlhB
MAEENGQERSERPTPKRLREARERGQVARSRELNTAAVVAAGAGALLVLGPHALANLEKMFRQALTPVLSVAAPGPDLLGAMLRPAVIALWGLAPILGLLLVAAALAPLLLGGWVFSPEAFAPKAERIDPIQGLGRIFSRRGLIELAKALGKFCLIAGFAVAWLWDRKGLLLGLGMEEPRQGLADASSLLGQTFLWLTLPLLLVAAIDVPLQIWEHGRRLRMTRQELKDELKDTEGKPEVKGRIQTIRRELARRRMMQQVPTADVIVSNPSHYAVALSYRAERMKAPVVVAKGVEWLALQIRALGKRHGVPVVESSALARALYYSSRLDEEIPGGLYMAVAQVLAYLYELRRQGTSVREPIVLAHVSVPDDYRRDL